MFKKFLLLFLFIFIYSSVCFAATATVNWTASGNGWETYIYVKDSDASSYDMTKPVAHATSSSTSIDVPNLVPGKTYYFVATHFDPATKVESLLSDEVSVNVPALPDKIVTPLPDLPIQNYKIIITLDPILAP